MCSSNRRSACQTLRKLSPGSRGGSKRSWCNRSSFGAASNHRLEWVPIVVGPAITAMERGGAPSEAASRPQWPDVAKREAKLLRAPPGCP